MGHWSLFFFTVTVPHISMTDAELSGTYENSTMVFGDINGTITFTGTVTDSDNAFGTFEATYQGMDFTGTWSGQRTDF